MVPQFCPPCGDAQEVTRIDPNWRDRQILGDTITRVWAPLLPALQQSTVVARHYRHYHEEAANMRKFWRRREFDAEEFQRHGREQLYRRLRKHGTRGMVIVPSSEGAPVSPEAANNLKPA